MYQFGSNEYGNKGGFKITCQCGREARIVPIHCRDNEKLKITLRFGAFVGISTAQQFMNKGEQNNERIITESDIKGKLLCLAFSSI